jgi:hypothetical protein
MGYTIRKVNNKNCYTVRKKKIAGKKPKGRQLFSKCTTMKNAKKQVRLLNAIKYNKNFVPYGRK